MALNPSFLAAKRRVTQSTGVNLDDVSTEVSPTLKHNAKQAVAMHGKQIMLGDIHYATLPLWAHELAHIVQQRGGTKIENLGAQDKLCQTNRQRLQQCKQLTAHQAEREVNENLPAILQGKRVALQKASQAELYQEEQPPKVLNSQTAMDAGATKVEQNVGTMTRIARKPLTENEVKKAIKDNNKLLFRTDWVLRLKHSLGLKINREKGRKAAVAFDTGTIRAIEKYQHNNQLATNGVIDVNTRLHIEANLFKETPIGTHTEAGEVLVSGVLSMDPKPATDNQQESKEESYLRCKEIIENDAKGYFDQRSGVVNILSIRGARLEGGKVIRTDSAKTYQKNAANSLHFWSGGKKGSEENSGTKSSVSINKAVFNDVMLNIWREGEGNASRYFVHARSASVDPGSLYNKGTSHLRDGQYVYQMGRHGTSSRKHMKAVIEACGEKTIHNILEPEVGEKTDGGKLKYHKTDYVGLQKIVFQDESPLKYNNIEFTRIQYNALVKKEPTEVIRESRDKNRNNGIIDQCEWEKSKKNTAANDSNFRDTKDKIGINIHTSPNHQSASEGCQNIPVASYHTFLQEIMSNASQADKASKSEEKPNSKEILYTLIDASKIASKM